MTDMPPYLAVKDEEKNSDPGDSDTPKDADDWDLPLVFNKPRHLEPIKGAERVDHTWRVKEKYKTHCVALVLCLNVGVDPPDVVKTQPCSRLECWIDPLSLSPSKALESIGHALQTQYERWQPRARYKQSLDPTSEEVKKLCCSLRRNAKDERVLFHYNGHGVPKPTTQGEIWVFNRAYTQYIPLSMYDLQTWMGAPSLYVYDCSNAGVIVDNFRQFSEQHEREYAAQASSKAAEGSAAAAVSYRNCIQLAACAAGQSLPMNPELPADLFTACLTTPVKMAMKWFVLRTAVRVAPPDVLDLIDKIPGQVTDRRTMLGELNWIFTAITDTIAWSSLPPELFQQLFRADLLTASLCRNFLLADRIMRSYNCTPVSSPALPSLARHPLWAAWEQTLDLALAQLPALLRSDAQEYHHSPFFRDQLTAFEVWLDLGKYRSGRAAPAQLPMVLQVLLSTLHRVRALRLLCRFLALGAWAARAVLHVGIFPYMLKLLQASAPDLRASMVYIWAKIIAVDPSCQVDLVNAKGHKYFLSVLQDPTVDSEHRTMAAYVLAGIVDQYPAGQEAGLQGSMISICLEQASDRSWRLAQWACISLGRLWRGYDAARWSGVRDLAHEKLYPLLQHRQPEVRAACAFALGTFMAAGGARTEHANALDQQVGVQLAATLQHDASPLVRRQLLAALQWIVLIFEQHFIAVYIQERVRKSKKSAEAEAVEPALDVLWDAQPPHAQLRHALPTFGFGSVYIKLWNTLTAMAREPHPQIARMAADIVDYVANQVDSVGRELEVCRSSSSLPPSPNTRPSPLAQHEHTRTLPSGRRSKSGLPHTISEDSVANRDRDGPREKERDFTSSNSSQGAQAAPGARAAKRPIVSSEYVEWAAAQFGGPERAAADCEGRPHHERAWRAERNRRLHADSAGTARRLSPLPRRPAAPLSPSSPSDVFGSAARRARGAAGDAGVPHAAAAAALRGAVPPVRAARRRRQQGQLQHLRLGHGGQAVHGLVAEAVGPHHRAGLPQRARARAAGRGLAHRQPGRVQADGQQPAAGAGGGVARAGRAAGGGLPAAAGAVRLRGGERRGRRGGRRAAGADAAALVRAQPHAGAGRPRGPRAAVGRRRRAAAGRHPHRERGGGDGAVARRRLAAAVRLRRRRAALLGLARAAPPAVRAAPARRARAGGRAAPGPARAAQRLRGRRGAHLRHAQDGRRRGDPRAGAAGRRGRAPALRPARLRIGEPEHQHLRPEGRAAEHHQVPRGLHGRAHRARLLPHLPPAQVRAGRGLEGLVRVGVRGGGPPVTAAWPPLGPDQKVSRNFMQAC